MKRKLIFSLVSIMLLLPLLMIGCSKTEETETITLTLDDFTAQNNIVKTVALTIPASLTVSLGSNPTTGYQWGEVETSNTSVITQASREFVEPENTGMVGAPGKDVWTFDSKKAGTATIKFSYSRPWEGGEKDTFTLTINVTVK